MNLEFRPTIPQAPTEPSVPWSGRDTWMGVLLLALLNAALLFIATQEISKKIVQSAGLVFLELAYLIPVGVILVSKKIHWKHLGFGKFEWSTVGLGCGLMVGAYLFIILHNVILILIGFHTQGEAIFEILASTESPFWLVIAAVILAPPVEEIFFRGFLFQGFRQRYGLVPGILISSLIFGLAHMDPTSLIPTFLLGAVLAYIYHRSNSVWPGIILHFLVNAFSVCALLTAMQLQEFIPL
ncbi:MAG TPA: CPBP family intramembrane glutamic endopeptidase [Anaerolineales bacterium]|nr:CPBP family intramembrane glutamic endopeptidase [Anaerolineales bacterium]